MRAVILLGAPGAGKGTVADAIKQRFGFRHISTGDMLREQVKQDSPIGREARVFMDQGELAPDAMVARMVDAVLDGLSGDARILFDGFPRTVVQAGLLDDMLAKRGSRVDLVIELGVPDRVIVDRIAGRRVCRACGAVYNLRSMPTRQPGVCDRCGGEVYQRPDDNEETVLNRLAVYGRQTAGLIDRYRAQGSLVRVDATHRDRTDEAVLALVGERAT